MLIEIWVEPVENQREVLCIKIKRRDQKHDSEVEEENPQDAHSLESHPCRICLEMSQLCQLDKDSSENNTLDRDCQSCAEIGESGPA